MFITDSTLLRFEPTIFRDAAPLSQRLLTAVASSTDGITVTLASADATTTSARIAPGHVAIVNSLAYEVLEVVNASTLRISRPRALPTDAPLPLALFANLGLTIPTLLPQIAIAHNRILRMLGIEPDLPDALQESQLANPSAFQRLEALGTLEVVMSSLGALQDARSPANQRAAFYRAEFTAECARVIAEFSLGGPETASRRPNATTLTRT